MRSMVSLSTSSSPRCEATDLLKSCRHQPFNGVPPLSEVTALSSSLFALDHDLNGVLPPSRVNTKSMPSIRGTDWRICIAWGERCVTCSRAFFARELGSVQVSPLISDH